MHGDLIRAQKQLNKRPTQVSPKATLLNSRFKDIKFGPRSTITDTGKPNGINKSILKATNRLAATTRSDRDCLAGCKPTRIFFVGAHCAANGKLSSVRRNCMANVPVQEKCQEKLLIEDQEALGSRHSETAGKDLDWRDVFCCPQRTPTSNNCDTPDVEDGGFLAVDAHELNFNVNAVHKSRSEESNGVCVGVLSDSEPDGSHSAIEDSGNFVQRQDRGSPSKVSTDAMTKLKDITPSGIPWKLFPDTLPLLVLHWLRDKLNVASSNFFPCRSLTGAQMYLVIATLFVLWTKLGVARSFFEHLLDTIIQVVLLTLLLTTTVVVFEANNMTLKIMGVFQSTTSLVKRMISDVQSSYVMEKGMQFRDTFKEKDHPNPNPNPNPTTLRVTDRCQPMEIADTTDTVVGDSKHEGHEPSDLTRSRCCTSPPAASESVQFSEGTTMTDITLPCNVQTMTEVLLQEGISTQTDSLCQVDGEEVTFYSLKNESILPSDSHASDAEVQTELDVKKIYEQTEKNKRSHAKSLRSLQRKFLSIRRCCQKKVREMKRFDMNRGDYLAKLQLQLPALQQEKSCLVAERALIEKQFADEKKKNRDLVNRMTKLNQQFYRLGQGYSSTATPTSWRQQVKGNNPQFYRIPGDQQQLPHQAVTLASGQHGAKIASRQLMLPQPQTSSVGLHGKQMNLQQQHPNKTMQTQQQLPSAIQQPRLPIFQLLQNSILSNAGQTASGFQIQCHQQLSSQTKNASINLHHPASCNPPFQQADQSASNRDCVFRKSSAEAASNS